MPRELVAKDATDTIGINVFDYVSADEKEFADGIATLAKKYEVSQQAMAIRISSIFA